MPLADLIPIAAVALLAALAVVLSRRAKKKGCRTGCGGDCSVCAKRKR